MHSQARRRYWCNSVSGSARWRWISIVVTKFRHFLTLTPVLRMPLFHAHWVSRTFIVRYDFRVSKPISPYGRVLELFYCHICNKHHLIIYIHPIHTTKYWIPTWYSNSRQGIIITQQSRMSILLRWHSLLCEPFADGAESPGYSEDELVTHLEARPCRDFCREGNWFTSEAASEHEFPHTHMLTPRLIQPMHALFAVKDHSNKNISYFPNCRMQIENRSNHGAESRWKLTPLQCLSLDWPCFLKKKVDGLGCRY